MSKYFVRDTSLAELERMMMEVPNFAPRRSSRTVLCRYHPQEAATAATTTAATGLGTWPVSTSPNGCRQGWSPWMS